MAFAIWSLVSLFFIIMAMVCFFSKTERPFGFWANAKMFQVNNVKAYNRALGKLWLTFGLVLELLGLPVLCDQNSPLVILTVIGAIFLTIGTMGVYMAVIEPKYKKK